MIVVAAAHLNRPTYMQLVRAQILMDKHLEHVHQHEHYAHRCLACDLWTVLNDEASTP